MREDLSGLRALVTGGTRGIGFSIVRALLANGAEVVTTGVKQDGAPVAGSEYRAVDFLDDRATNTFVDEVKKMSIDILINNAGINRIDKFTEIRPVDFDNIHRVNVRTPFLLCQSVLPHMISRRWGRIVNISSIFGIISKELRGSYSASKFALDGLTVALAAEVAKYGVLVNCVSPGFIDTDLTRAVLGEKGIAEVTSRIPIGRLGRPEEIAAFVAWLVGPDNTYISGQNLAIDGGFSRV